MASAIIGFAGWLVGGAEMVEEGRHPECMRLKQTSYSAASGGRLRQLLHHDVEYNNRYNIVYRVKYHGVEMHAECNNKYDIE